MHRTGNMLCHAIRRVDTLEQADMAHRDFTQTAVLVSSCVRAKNTMQQSKQLMGAPKPC